MAQISQCPLFNLGGPFLRFALVLVLFEIATLSCEGVLQTHILKSIKEDEITAVEGNKEES